LEAVLNNSIFVAQIFDCPIKTLPITYLGLPMALGKITKPSWGTLIEKMQKRLASWNGKLLSLGGRITMINAALSAIPTYFMSYFLLPRWVKRKIDCLRRNFLWKETPNDGKGFSLVNWNRV